MTGDRPDDRREERRRKRVEVFGDVLPEGTRDDQDEPDTEAETASEEWLRRNVPPHHG